MLLFDLSFFEKLYIRYKSFQFIAVKIDLVPVNMPNKSFLFVFFFRNLYIDNIVFSVVITLCFV